MSADDEDLTGRANWVPDWQYSATTTYYQSLVMEAWGDKCKDPNPRKSRQDNRGTARGRSSDARYARVRGAVPAARPGSGRAEWRTAEPGRPSRTAPSGPPVRPTREQMLDPRYSDPDWTPWHTPSHGNLPAGADHRDFERVEQETAHGRGRVQ